MNRAVFSRPGRARVAGVDEAGRGPLAGPVVAAAVILPEDHGIAGIDDSKKLTAEDREALAVRIDERAIAVSVASASVEEIDRLNILWASLLAMKRAVEGLSTTPEHVLVDGNRAPQLSQTSEAIVRGDQTETVIAAASIIAKVRRDAIMAALHQDFPFYGWDRNKGYPTREHKQELMRMGACRHHRTSFAPVRAALAITAGSVSGAPV